ncbi:MAG: aminopeptidase P N-terminal domain-containing protein [Bacteroidetes bacterium]|nr:aminopeptidase P N-terminal domain-containing protein [Bacteroidota bacterium]
MTIRVPTLLLCLFCCLPTLSVAQSLVQNEQYAQYDSDRLPASFHRSRRDSVVAHMSANSAALFLGGVEKNRANDVSYEFHQDPNFYYLTGHIQPNAALLIIKEKEQAVRQILFVEAKNPARETWTGIRLGTDGAKRILGFEEAEVIDSLPSVLSSLLPRIETFYYSPNYGMKVVDPAIDSGFGLSSTVVSILERRYPKLVIRSLLPILSRLRMVKTTEELVLMRKAVSISNEGHNEIMRTVQPGWYEYQMQALGEYVFKRHGAEYTGYPCIVGSGNNSTILHYETNRRKTESGDFVEMDIGAEYHGYSADVTRSFPVNGTFTPEQRAIYEIVLEAQDSGIAAVTVGGEFRAAHYAALSVIQRGLLKLGIISTPNEAIRYFMHGTSHFLGLDVHDAGVPGPLPENAVITVEPGIYIPAGSPCDPKWWKIGCRIEDDILVTASGPEILSSGSPRRIQEIEALMKKGK